MSNPTWIVTDLQALRRPDGASFELWVTMDGPARFPVPPECLLCYTAFQRIALLKTGGIYRHIACEGRPIEAADEVWRQFTSAIRYAPPVPPESPPAGAGSGPVN